MEAKKENQPQKLHTDKNKRIIIVSITVLLVVGIAVALLFLRTGDSAIFGKAIQVGEYAPTTKTSDNTKPNSLEWYFGWKDVTGGTDFGNYSGEKFTVPIRVDFGTGNFQVNIFRLKLSYDDEVLEFVKYENKAGPYVALKGGKLLTHDATANTVTYEGTFDTGKSEAQGFHSNEKGKSYKTIAEVTFKIKVTKNSESFDPTKDKDKTKDYGGAVKLVSANTYAAGQANSKTGLGIFAKDTQWLKATPQIASLTVKARPPCAEKDGDQFGLSNTDQRSCNKRNADDKIASAGSDPNFNDCDGNKVRVYPGAPEICDGVANNCLKLNLNDVKDDGSPLDIPTINGIPDDPNKKKYPFLYGVCVGNKVCEGGKEVNSYEATGNTLKFTAGKDACDFFDNDCDGKINEDDANCKIGGGGSSLISDPWGNTYIDYDVATKKHKSPQEITNSDFFLELFLATSDASCGISKAVPCYGKPGGADTWFCKDGTYYQKFTGDNNYYKLSKDKDLEVISSGYTSPLDAVTKEPELKNGGSLVKCV